MYCIWCGERDCFQQGRTHERDGVHSVDYWCLYCEKQHTRKDEVEEAVFLFFPADIEAMRNDDAEPIDFPFEKGKEDQIDPNPSGR
jgi:hypothetical protein